MHGLSKIRSVQFPQKTKVVGILDVLRVSCQLVLRHLAGLPNHLPRSPATRAISQSPAQDPEMFGGMGASTVEYCFLHSPLPHHVLGAADNFAGLLDYLRALSATNFETAFPGS